MSVSRSLLIGESALGVFASVYRLVREAALVGAAIVMLTLLTIGTSQAHTTNDSSAQGVTGLSAHVIVKRSVAEVGTLGITSGHEDNCGETSDPSHGNHCCPGSICSLALNNATYAKFASPARQVFIAGEQAGMSPLELDGQFRPPRIYS